MLSRRSSKCLLLFQMAVILLCSHAAPQQNPIIQANIDKIFATTSSAVTPRPGFNVVVTPETVDPSQPQTQFNSISGKPPCNCVRYHLCDPNGKVVEDNEEFDGFGVIDIRFDSGDQRTCEHYLDVCCDDNNTHTESLIPTQPNRKKGCGIRNVGGVDFNITGANDNEAGYGEFPWTVAILHSNNLSYFCAGSLIHPSVVLTAAHCIIDRPITSFIVRAGEWDSLTTKERLPYQERTVKRVITHPQYNPRNVANDFALVILNDPLPLEDHINVVCLPNQDAVPVPSTTCISTGWGKDVFGEAGRYSAILKRISLPIVDFNSCQSQLRGTKLGPKFALNRSFICAGGKRGIDTCQGDGGAPLVCPIGIPSENRYHQSGIVAWGIGCGTENVPAAYANVAMARNWIDEQMLANGFDTSSYSAL